MTAAITSPPRACGGKKSVYIAAHECVGGEKLLRLCETTINSGSHANFCVYAHLESDHYPGQCVVALKHSMFSDSVTIISQHPENAKNQAKQACAQ